MLILKQRNKAAIISKEQKISYAELVHHIFQYATLLPKTEFDKRVAIVSENRPEWVYTFFGAWKSGYLTVPIDFMATPQEIAYILNDSQPEYIFCSVETRKRVTEAVSMVPFPVKIISIPDLQNFPDLTEPLQDLGFSGEKPATIIYTSGTTGTPKGAVLTFNNILATASFVADSINFINEQDKMLALLPLHHIYPLGATMGLPLYKGAAIVFCPSLDKADILKTLSDHQVTIIAGIPRLYDALMQAVQTKINSSRIKKMGFKIAERIHSKSIAKIIFREVHQKLGGHMKYLLSAGAPLNPDVVKNFQTLGCEVIEAYGMTESTSLISITRPGKTKVGAVGQPVDHVTVKIVDNEIIVQGPNVMSGYYNRPEETAAIIKDGWLYTGDTGYLDDDGYLFITGRKKDIIVSPSGKNINPEELEMAIKNQTDLIDEIGIFLDENVLHALIYPSQDNASIPGSDSLKQFFQKNVIAQYNQSVSPYKKISRVTIIDEELPKTRVGKLRRFLLKDLAAQYNMSPHSVAAGCVAISENDMPLPIMTGNPSKNTGNISVHKLSKWLTEQIAERKSLEVEDVDDQLPFIEMGIDSLDAIEITDHMENTFSVSLPKTLFWDYPTIEECCLHIHGLLSSRPITEREVQKAK